MSRSHFVLAIALVVIAATLVFFKTFPDAPAPGEAPRPDRASHATGRPGERSMDVLRSTKLRAPRPAGKSSFKIGFSKATLDSLTSDQQRRARAFAATAEAEARETLAELTEKYRLTRQQQGDIFPIVAAHTDSYHQSMTVNGASVIPAQAGSSLEEQIHGSLDAEQQAALADAMIDDIKWWQEIANQLEDDLNSAIGNGEITTGLPADPAPIDTAPAQGDGEAASHSGGSIFDLLNQGN